MTPETRKLYKKNAYNRSKTIRKSRVDKLLNNQDFDHFYTMNQSVKLENTYIFCSFRRLGDLDCMYCQDCAKLYF